MNSRRLMFPSDRKSQPTMFWIEAVLLGGGNPDSSFWASAVTPCVAFESRKLRRQSAQLLKISISTLPAVLVVKMYTAIHLFWPMHAFRPSAFAAASYNC